MTISELTESDFEGFFTSLWDRPPFAWQSDLTERVLTNREAPWPQAIALPTGAGKTTCLDIAVFALAAQAAMPGRKEAITAPRRIFLVVDRRIVVDEAYERAYRMSCKLQDATGGILKQVADNLREIAGHTESSGMPLEAHILRGGMYRSEAWSRSPLQPSVITSTVDQIGSRLLFRAYGGSSSRVWPIYAGLVANDSLVLVDEAHCAHPFLQTLQAVKKYRQWGEQPLQRPFLPVVMSATPPSDLKDKFTDSSSDPRNPEHPLGRRQLASKPARLILDEIKGGRKAEASEKVAKAVVEYALELAGDEPKAIVAFVNRVATARAAKDLLIKKKDIDCELLTGRMRTIDKEAVQGRLESLHSGVERTLERSLIVVATQTLEVGADLDFDGLVTECASLDALRQRFGRLNRMGRDIEAKAIIIYVDNGKEADPVYGEAMSKTWEWLGEQKDENDEVDFGIAELQKRLHEGEELSKLNAPTTDAAVMLPAHLDCLAQTEPAPKPSPAVSLFLHGLREAVRDVEVCWRADVDLTDDKQQENSLESLRLCPPTGVETLAVPIGLFKCWLAGFDGLDNSADVEGVNAEDESQNATNEENQRRVLRWRGRETRLGRDIISEPADIHPGEIIVIPFSLFPESTVLGDLTASDVILDQGESAYLRVRAKAALRLHPVGIGAWPESLALVRDDAKTLLEGLSEKYEDDSEEVMTDVHNVLKRLAEVGDLPEEQWRWLPEVASVLVDEFPTAEKLNRSGACHVRTSSLTIVGRKLVKKYTRDASIFSDEDDASSSGISHKNGKPVLLKKHLPGVEEFARNHAIGCGLPDAITEAIARAGLLHDLGKADPRFQQILRRGGIPVVGEMLAKSSRYPRDRNERERIRRESGYPEGARHELLSVRMAESVPELLPEDTGLKELVLHLVASHHGYGRPFAPVVNDENHPETKFPLGEHCNIAWSWPGGPLGLERLDSGVSERYWHLTRRYGWWGLAWLEALLRIADWRRSEWEEQNDDNA